MPRKKVVKKVKPRKKVVARSKKAAMTAKIEKMRRRVPILSAMMKARGEREILQRKGLVGIDRSDPIAQLRATAGKAKPKKKK